MHAERVFLITDQAGNPTNLPKFDNSGEIPLLLDEGENA